MQKFRRNLPFIGAILLAATLEGVDQYYAWWIVGFIAVTLIIIFVGALLTNFERILKGWWHTVMGPLFLGLSTVGLILFVNSEIARQFILAFASILTLFFWENLWRYYWAPERYNVESLDNTSLVINTVTIWFTVDLFFNILLDTSVLPDWLAAHALIFATLLILVAVVLLDYGTIWVQRYPLGKVWLWLIVTALVVSEVFWVTNFLPNQVEVKTYLVVLVYYLLTHLGRAHLDGNLRPGILRRYAYLAAGSLLAVLYTARWVL